MIKPIVILRKAHKWLGLFVGIQVFFWVFGGLIMTLWPIEEIRGSHLYKLPEKKQVSAEQIESLSKLLIDNNMQASQISIESGYTGSIAKVQTADNNTIWFDLNNQAALQPIEETDARDIADSIYTGKGKVSLITKIMEHSSEYKRQLPAWKVNFDDEESTVFYLDAQTGELSSVRTDRWRLFDFVWMLHIMDYEERENFHHPLIITAASLALLMVFSGIYLIFKTFSRRDVKWLVGAKAKK
ncbi:MAG: PepSY domain-containing protein [Gammaproteobacteria bacterium]|nr:PepSY domain-containing protein [Gammaproteobacteria bacterium]